MKATITTIAILMIAACSSGKKTAKEMNAELDAQKDKQEIRQMMIDTHILNAKTLQELGSYDEAAIEMRLADSLINLNEF